MENTYYHLEFYKIIDLIKNECHSNAGKLITAQISPLKDKKIKLQKINLIGELQKLSIHGYNYLFENLSDLTELLVEWKHNSYSFEEFQPIIHCVSIANLISSDLDNFTDFPIFRRKVAKLSAYHYLEKRFNEIFSPEGEVLDSASKALFAIRKRKRQLRENIVKELGGIQRDQQWENFIQEKIITNRDDRYVILLKEGATGFMDGISHGRSGSQSSVYFEPKQVVGLNNELNKLDSDEKREIYRIFCEYSQQIFDVKDQIYENSKILGEMDSEFATARFSNRIMASIPEFVDEPYIELIKARHPLLIIQFKDFQKVIPFNLKLGHENKILLISGPNTGGKTITLKTIGLLTLMAHSGLPVPCDSYSKIGCYDKVYADIGDNQSIESYLSSFSAHIKNISEMLDNGDENTLVLVDEIGSATDPEQGSALAQAVLEKLVSQKVTGIITTHYTALKIFAEQSDSCVNASMQFDSKSHQPTFQFQFGMPGHSFAIEIAARLGISEDVIAKAKLLAGNQSVELTHLLAKITEEKKKLSQASYQFELKTRLLEQRIKEHETKTDEMEAQKKKLLREAVLKANDEFVHIQKELIREIDEIRKLNREEKKQKLEDVLRKATHIQSELHDQADSLIAHKNSMLTNEKIDIGSIVWLKKLDTLATVMEINKDIAKVDMNGIFFNVPLTNLILQQAKNQPQEVLVSNKNVGDKPTAKLELKVLGLTFDEAIPLIDEFIDNAIVNRLNRIRIVHGKGTGILRKKIRAWLKKNKRVTDFFAPPPEAGGDGVTVVCVS
ncbi:MAG TPA: Smr/MutS family protein, partial [Candidatus Cloacimonadota bacterium]|nr:Smr/MutS family protein [Candidatus Cloacimonadota bacterium]